MNGGAWQWRGHHARRRGAVKSLPRLWRASLAAARGHRVSIAITVLWPGVVAVWPGRRTHSQQVYTFGSVSALSGTAAAGGGITVISVPAPAPVPLLVAGSAGGITTDTMPPAAGGAAMTAGGTVAVASTYGAGAGRGGDGTMSRFLHNGGGGWRHR